MKTSRLLTLVLAIFAFLSVAVLMTRAGPLDPPPGPPQPTDRMQLNAQWISLPYTIDHSGSYVLTSSLTGTSASHGLVVDADNVTIDLNGFALIGVPGSLDGIHVPSPHTNVTIHGGSLYGWGAAGVNVRQVIGARLYALQSRDNVATGLFAGPSAHVRDCITANNTANGIDCETGSAILNCIARDNQGVGILANHGSTVSGCSTYANDIGIQGQQSTCVSSCTAYVNQRDGIQIRVGIVTNCTTSQNGLDGINSDSACVITACNAWDNHDDGFDVDEGAVVRSCNAYQNAGAGILVRGGPSRIENNYVSRNAYGVESDGFGFIIGNYAAFNTTNYDLSASDRYGALFVPSAGFSNSSRWANVDDGM